MKYTNFLTFIIQKSHFLQLSTSKLHGSKPSARADSAARFVNIFLRGLQISYSPCQVSCTASSEESVPNLEATLEPEEQERKEEAEFILKLAIAEKQTAEQRVSAQPKLEKINHVEVTTSLKRSSSPQRAPELGDLDIPQRVCLKSMFSLLFKYPWSILLT